VAGAFPDALELGVLHLETAAILADAAIAKILGPGLEGRDEEPGVEPDNPHRAGRVLDEGLQPVAPARRAHLDKTRTDGGLAPG